MSCGTPRGPKTAPDLVSGGSGRVTDCYDLLSDFVSSPEAESSC